MFSHNLKQILPGLWKYKSFTLINLIGLSIGIAAVLLIFMIADYEKSFDKLHTHSNAIYRLVEKNNSTGKNQYEAVVPYPSAKLLRNEYPGVQATHLNYTKEASVRLGSESPFEEKNILFADSLFFNVFDFSSINNFRVRGNIAAALSAPGKAILTTATAKRYFGLDNPIGSKKC